MKKIEFKQLVPEQIEVRFTDTKVKNKATLLLYIDSRAAADILNKTIGEYNWTIEYKSVGDKVFGRLSVWDEDKKIWIFREDTGEESNIAADKGLSSDILKRCLARFGCDWLYHTPRIKINCPDSYYYNDKMTMTFSVKEIKWDENKELISLIILDKFGKEVYNYSGMSECVPVSNESRGQMSKRNTDILRDFCSSKKNEEGVDKADLKRFYDFYYEKVDTWENRLKPEIIWNSWCKTRR